MSSADRILVFIELTEDHKINPASLEAVFAGRLMANQSGLSMAALMIGSNIPDAATELNEYGVDEIYVQNDYLLQNYHPEWFLSVLEKACEVINPGFILMADSIMAQDLAPRAAFRLNGALIADCVGINFESEAFCYSKPVYSGNVTAVFSTDAKPQIAILRSHIYEAAKPAQNKKAEIISLNVQIDPSKTVVEILERVKDEDKAKKLTSAEIVVSGGRGIGGTEGFQLLRELADILNAGIAASRPPCDLGWISPKAQVGLTGEIVAPSVYFAVGISGSTQHVAGMMNSRIVIAVNKDPQAQIFKIADYGVVGSYEDVLPALIKEIREFKNG